MINWANYYYRNILVEWLTWSVAKKVLCSNTHTHTHTQIFFTYRLLEFMYGFFFRKMSKWSIVSLYHITILFTLLCFISSSNLLSALFSDQNLIGIECKDGKEKLGLGQGYSSLQRFDSVFSLSEEDTLLKCWSKKYP